MASKDDNAPIIIKKKKKGGHGAHHGGAWKVAYADFVTAMMAFFLLMWLINATTEEQKTGLADYFSPTSISQSSSGGGGMLAGQTLSTEGALVDDRAPVAMTMEVPAPPSRRDDAGGGPDDEEALRQQAEAEDESFENAAEHLREALSLSPELEELSRHVEIDQTEEGLRIQLVDRDEGTMFPSGGTEPLPRTQELLTLVSNAVADMPNKLSVKGHTDAIPFASANGYGNWELSTDRANASRRVLQRAGLGSERIAQVVGMADQDLLVPDDPSHPRNRRISIILLREAPPQPLTNRAAEGRTPQRQENENQQRQAPAGPSILGRD